MRKATLICISDVHFSHRQPTAQDNENWYEVMYDQFHQLRILWDDIGQPKIAIAGDVFDKWNPPIQLVNYVSSMLKDMFGENTIYAVPGQHDMPYHTTQNLWKSAYANLVQNNVIVDINGRSVSNGELTLYGFGWESERRRNANTGPGQHVALIHKYAFMDKRQAYKGCDLAQDYKTHEFTGFDLLHYGDNHIRWSAPGVVNPGTFYTRYKNDIGQPCGAYILHDDNTVTSWNVDQSEQNIRVPKQEERAATPEVNIDRVLGMLNALDVSTNDPRQYIRQLLKQSTATDAAKGIINNILEEIDEQKRN